MSRRALYLMIIALGSGIPGVAAASDAYDVEPRTVCGSGYRPAGPESGEPSQ